MWKTPCIPIYTVILTNPNSSTEQFDAAYFILVEKQRDLAGSLSELWEILEVWALIWGSLVTVWIGHVVVL